MSDKITLGSIASFQNDTTAAAQYNANNAIIITGVDNTLSRDGTSPNQMSAPIDMNSRPIINLPAPSSLGEPLRLADVNSVISVIPTFGNVSQLRYTFKSVNFNSANTDNVLPITLPPGATIWRCNGGNVFNASSVITTATIGLFTGAGGTGITIGSNQTVTISSIAPNTNGNTYTATILNAGTEAYNLASIFLRVGTAQGTPVTADVTIFIFVLG